MLEAMGQFGLHYKDQAQGTLWSLVVTPSLLRRVIEFDIEILSIKDRVLSSTSDEGWAMHIDSSLQYRGKVVVPQSENLR